MRIFERIEKMADNEPGKGTLKRGHAGETTARARRIDLSTG